MQPYSIDLREQVIQSVESGACNIPQAGKRSQISEPSIERRRARQRAMGSCAPLPHAGGPVRKSAAAEKAIRAAVKARPDATLAEFCETVVHETLLVASPGMMCREL